MMNCKTLTQNSLEDLARAAPRQLGFRELDAAWNLVIGKRPPAMGDQVIHAEGLSRLQHDACRHELAPLGIRYSENGRFTNRRKLVNHSFDLTGVDVLTARDDHVLQAVQDVEIAFRILVAEVSRTKQPV